MDNKKIALNGLLSGIIAGIATKVIFGQYGSAEYFGMELDNSLITALGVGTGSIISDLTSEYVIKKLNVSNQIQNGSTVAVEVAISGGASSAILWAGGVPISSMPATFILGGGSALAGRYANERIFDGRTGFIPLF